MFVKKGEFYINLDHVILIQRLVVEGNQPAARIWHSQPLIHDEAEGPVPYADANFETEAELDAFIEKVLAASKS